MPICRRHRRRSRVSAGNGSSAMNRVKGLQAHNLAKYWSQHVYVSSFRRVEKYACLFVQMHPLNKILLVSHGHLLVSIDIFWLLHILKVHAYTHARRRTHVVVVVVVNR